MHTVLMVGIPTSVILVLTGIAIFERYCERADDRKRDQQLKRWIMSHYTATP